MLHHSICVWLRAWHCYVQSVRHFRPVSEVPVRMVMDGARSQKSIAHADWRIMKNSRLHQNDFRDIIVASWRYKASPVSASRFIAGVATLLALRPSIKPNHGRRSALRVAAIECSEMKSAFLLLCRWSQQREMLMTVIDFQCLRLPWY